jgi:hypothetical protein
MTLRPAWALYCTAKDGEYGMTSAKPTIELMGLMG